MTRSVSTWIGTVACVLLYAGSASAQGQVGPYPDGSDWNATCPTACSHYGWEWYGEISTENYSDVFCDCGAPGQSSGYSDGGTVDGGDGYATGGSSDRADEYIEPPAGNAGGGNYAGGGNAGGGGDYQAAMQLLNRHRSTGYNCGGQQFGPAGPLSMHQGLSQAATNWSQQMQQMGQLSHDRMQERISAVCGQVWMGENVAAGQQNPVAAVESWMTSPGHCSNIMNPNYNLIGFGGSGNYWTQLFTNQC